MSKAEVKFEIVKQIAIISRNEKSGWTKRLNLVSWYGAAPKLDVREWDKDLKTCGKGIVLTEEEADELRIALGNMKF